MVYILIEHAVEDYETWKPYFEDHDDTREEYGQTGYRLFRGAEDQNDLSILFEWDSMENAQAFLEESDVRDLMEEAGVVGEPEITFLDEVEARMPGRSMA